MAGQRNPSRRGKPRASRWRTKLRQAEQTLAAAEETARLNILRSREIRQRAQRDADEIRKSALEGLKRDLSRYHQLIGSRATLDALLTAEAIRPDFVEHFREWFRRGAVGTLVLNGRLIVPAETLP